MRATTWKLRFPPILPVIIAVLWFGPVSADDRERMRLAVEQMRESQLPSGLIPYQFNFLADRSIETDKIPFANLARQAGTAASLALYSRHTRDARTQTSVRSALEAFGRLSLPIGKGDLQSVLEGIRLLSLPFLRVTLRRTLDLLGLLYDASGDGKVISPDGDYEKAWLGSTALALLTEIHYFFASGDHSFAELRQAWLKGVLALRIPGRGFRQLPHVINESPFANGEAWLALAHYLAAFPDDPAVATVIKDIDDYMVGKYSSDFNFRFYQWGTMAAAVRAKSTSDPKFLQFIKDQAKEFLDVRPPEETADFNTCASIEGLATAAAVIEVDGGADLALLDRIKDRVALEMAKNRKLQIQPGQERIDLGGDGYLWSSRLQEYAGAFLVGLYAPTTRIDASAHCLSALIIMERAGLNSDQ